MTDLQTVAALRTALVELLEASEEAGHRKTSEFLAEYAEWPQNKHAARRYLAAFTRARALVNSSRSDRSTNG